MSRDQGLHYDYSSQPQSPLLYMPDTPSSSQNLGWSTGQGYGSPTTPTLRYNQFSAQYDNFEPSSGQYQYPTTNYPYHIVDSALASPMLDFWSQNLHIHTEGLHMLSPQKLSLMAPDQQKSPVAFQTGAGLYSPNGSVTSLPFMPGSQSSWQDAAVYMTTPSPSQAASLSRTWSQPTASMTAPVLQEGRYRKLSASSESSPSSLSVINKTVVTRRRQQKPKGARIHKCDEPGCNKDFDRKFNADKHKETVHQGLPRKEKCPIQNCEYETKGFVRKHDLDRHVIAVYVFVLRI